MGNTGNVWYREVQPLFNNMIRNQILDIFSDGVKRSAHEQGIDDPRKAFDPVTGIHANILDRESYYTEVCAYSIDPVAGCDDVGNGDRGFGGSESLADVVFSEHCPVVFSYLRYKGNIDPEEYISEFENVETGKRGDG